ncbi:MAG: hypothetical protein QNJ63_07835 [Calothrix sp. MO_192.B10]|nr:hypothetical protein [Calothrix sp. MO_192.B10]
MHGQLQPPPNSLLEPILQPLLELREHYARLVEEYETLYKQAQSQLIHVEGLLSSWSGTRPTDSQPSMGQNVASALPSPNNGIASLPKPESIHPQLQDSDSLELNALPSQETVSSSLPGTSAINYPSSSHWSEIPLLTEHRALSRIQAIEKILEKNVGTVCHIDFVVRSLYGDLEPTVFKVVKGRVHSSLTHGKEKGYWYAVPDEPGCYTYDISKVPHKKGKAKSQAGKKIAKKPLLIPKTRSIPLIPKYEGKFLIDAVSSLLQDRPKKAFSVAEIMEGIYGELTDDQIRHIKSAVLNELSRGHRIGRFSRVPGKIGMYTWNLKMYQDAKSD